MVICLERGAELHTAQLMPLPLTVSCFSKIQIGFTFLVAAYPGSPDKGPLNARACVCCVSIYLSVCVSVCLSVYHLSSWPSSQHGFVCSLCVCHTTWWLSSSTSICCCLTLRLSLCTLLACCCFPAPDCLTVASAVQLLNYGSVSIASDSVVSGVVW